MSIYKKTNPDPPCCIHNDAVNCKPNERHCETCGWDPAVEANRLAKFCKEHGISIPEPKTEQE